MGYDFVRYLGETLDRPVSSKLIYFWLAYQIVVSALVFLFDAGFPAWVVIAGWALFILALAIKALTARKQESDEEKKDKKEAQTRLQRISQLKKRLENDPGLQTRCHDCENHVTADDSCEVDASAGERQFRFHHADDRFFCLRWSPKTE